MIAGPIGCAGSLLVVGFGQTTQTESANPMPPPLVPPELLDPVVAYSKPRRVTLFGSRARGDARPDSDIDLLVVVDGHTPAEKITIKAGFEARQFYHKSNDVIPEREETFRRNAKIAATLSRAATLDGVVVYEPP